MVLTSLHAWFSLELEEYSVVIFTEVKEALDFIKQNSVNVVVTDYEMPNLDGIRLLTKVKTIDPSITRIILSGRVNKEWVIKAINDVGVFQVIEKPWDNEKLGIVIEKAVGKSKKSKLLIMKKTAEEVKRVFETSHDEPSGRGKVLFVDDEEMVLTSLSSFLELETDYEILTFTSPKEALIYIRRNEVDIIIADYLMPEMDGISFLAEVKRIAPNCPSILLTGYADKENARKAVNELGLYLYHYIEKPWDNDDLKIVFRNGIELKRRWEAIHKKNKDKKELVFISYAREDQEFALSLARILKNDGIETWIAKLNLAPGSDWDKDIDNALEICTKLIVVLSEAAVNSEEVRAEWRLALDAGKTIIPVLYKECKPPRRLALIQNFDFRSTTLADTSKINQLLGILKDDIEYDWALF